MCRYAQVGQRATSGRPCYTCNHHGVLHVAQQGPPSLCRDSSISITDNVARFRIIHIAIVRPPIRPDAIGGDSRIHQIEEAVHVIPIPARSIRCACAVAIVLPQSGIAAWRSAIIYDWRDSYVGTLFQSSPKHTDM